MTLVFLGCDLRAPTSESVRQERSSVGDSTPVEEHASIDAGVVVAGRDGYLCLPLEQVGLTTSDEAVALETSCKCLRGSLVTYIPPADSLSQAILLEYVGEQPASDGPQPLSETVSIAVNLGVTVEVHLRGGGTHAFTVRLLHSILV